MLYTPLMCNALWGLSTSSFEDDIAAPKHSGLLFIELISGHVLLAHKVV